MKDTSHALILLESSQGWGKTEDDALKHSIVLAQGNSKVKRLHSKLLRETHLKKHRQHTSYLLKKLAVLKRNSARLARYSSMAYWKQ
jgi:hypothetical protein